MLTDTDVADLKWLHALAMTAMRDPAVIDYDIESFWLSLVPSLFFRTDASTSIGGGCVLSHVEGGPHVPDMSGYPTR